MIWKRDDFPGEEFPPRGNLYRHRMPRVPGREEVGPGS